MMAVLALATTPCATPGAPVPKHLMPKEEPLFFPTKVGDRMVSVLGSQEIVCVVTKVEKVADGIAVRVEEEDEKGAHNHAMTVIASSKGLKVVRYGIRELAEPAWWLKLPHGANNEWEDTLNGRGWKYRTIGWQQIEVPAGKFLAMGVERDDGTTYWYAPGLWCVKCAREDVSRELKSFTPGK